MSKNRKITPSGNKEETSGQEQNVKKPEDYSKWKVIGNKRVGAKWRKNGRLLQVESNRKQAGRSKMSKKRKITPSGKQWEISV